MPQKTATEKREHAARLAFWLTEYTRRNLDFRRDCDLYEAQVKLINDRLGWTISPWKQLEFFAASVSNELREYAALLQGCYVAVVTKHGMQPLAASTPEWSLEILYHVASGRARHFTKDFSPFHKLFPRIEQENNNQPSWETWRKNHESSLVALHDTFKDGKRRLGLRQEQEEARAIGLFLFDLVEGCGLTLSQAVDFINGDDGLFPGLRSSDCWLEVNNRPWRELLHGTQSCIEHRRVMRLTRNLP